MGKISVRVERSYDNVLYDDDALLKSKIKILLSHINL